MLDIYAPTASAPENNAGTVGCSDMLRYTESDVYLVDGRVKGVPDDMVGKHGLAWFRPSESRWYFREYGTDDSRLVGVSTNLASAPWSVTRSLDEWQGASGLSDGNVRQHGGLAVTEPANQGHQN